MNTAQDEITILAPLPVAVPCLVKGEKGIYGAHQCLNRSTGLWLPDLFLSFLPHEKTALYVHGRRLVTCESRSAVMLCLLYLESPEALQLVSTLSGQVIAGYSPQSFGASHQLYTCLANRLAECRGRLVPWRDE